MSFNTTVFRWFTWEVLTWQIAGYSLTWQMFRHLCGKLTKDASHKKIRITCPWLVGFAGHIYYTDLYLFFRITKETIYVNSWESLEQPGFRYNPLKFNYRYSNSHIYLRILPFTTPPPFLVSRMNFPGWKSSGTERFEAGSVVQLPPDLEEIKMKSFNVCLLVPGSVKSRLMK